jgi:hypothetical protein
MLKFKHDPLRSPGPAQPIKTAQDNAILLFFQAEDGRDETAIPRRLLRQDVRE